MQSAAGRLRARALPTACLLVGLASSALALQLSPDFEGPLNNDSFLPTSAEAQAALGRGDRRLEEARAATGDRRARLRDEAFEAWRDALVAAGAVPFPTAAEGQDPLAASAARVVEDARFAVERRLAALAPGEREAWSARFASRAATELEAAGRDRDALVRVLARNPLTPAAAQAALRLADLALERGATRFARAWAERGLAQLGSAGAGTDERLSALAAALRARAAYEQPAADPPPTEAWETARALEPLGTTVLGRLRDPRRRFSKDNGPGRGVRPGLARLAGGRLAVQTHESVHLLQPRDGAAPRLAATFDPTALVAKGLGYPPTPVPPEGPPGWAHLPAAVDGDLVLVAGQGRRSGSTNALLRVTPPREEGTKGLFGAGDVPVLRWAISGHRHLDGDGIVTEPALLAPFRSAEMQPGVLRVGAHVLAQVRVPEGETNAWLVCLDAVTGLPLWTRFLAKGSDLVAGGGRFDAQSGRPLRAQALQGPFPVFAGTHLGAGSLVDPLDGSLLWTLKNRRRELGAPGWDGGRPLHVRPGEADATLLWAPADTDQLYWLRAAPLAVRAGSGGEAGPGAPLSQLPRAIGEAIALAGGSPDGALVLSRAGPARTISTWSAATGERLDSLDLARGEEFRSTGLASAARLFVATDRGLYLFDRMRELYLLDYATLTGRSPGGIPPGGSVHGFGDQVHVLGPERVWSFTAR